MTLTFEELKFLILDKQRRIEINKLFHLYVKAQSYSEILQLLKAEANFKWILQNGFLEYVQYFPEEDLAAQNIFVGTEIEISDSNSDIILLNGATLLLNQSGSNRCKVIIENGYAEINITDTAMVEVETYQKSRGEMVVNNSGWGYLFLTARNTAMIALNGADKSTFAVTAYQDVEIEADLQNDSYIYSVLYDNAILTTNSSNIHGKENDESKIIIE